MEKLTPTNIIFHEWKQILADVKRKDIGWREKIYYLFGPPGWSHDGSRQTSEQLRLEEIASSNKNGDQQGLPYEEESLAPAMTSIKQ
jgi:hypothetical protein